MGSSEIRVTVTLNSAQFTSALQAVQSSITRLSNSSTQQTSSIGKSFSNMGSTIQNAGLRATVAGTAVINAFKPVASILSTGIKSVVSFDTAMRGVAKT